jgi:nitrogen-specific signal transduction histidine kinase
MHGIGGADGRELVFALCHEVGNLVGAVRLQAHLIDAGIGARELAQASLDLDHLSARSAALLAHIRPLLSGAPVEVDAVEPEELLRSLEALMYDHGGRGVSLDFGAEASLPTLRVDREVLHHLLQSLLYATLESAVPRDSVSMRVVRHGDGVAFELEDDAEVDESPAEWREQAGRGRPLLYAVAQHLLDERGGRLEITRREGRTRVVLELPVA